MTEQSPAELERDAERVRAQLAQTTEELKERMSPGQLMDEVVNYFKDGDSSKMLANMKHQVRDNPMALAMVGAGVAWLMMGNGPGDREHVARRSAPDADGSAPGHGSHLSGSRGNGAAFSRGAAGGKLSGATASSTVGSNASGFASTVRDAASGTMEKASAAASSATESVASAMHNLRDSAGSGLSGAADTGTLVAQRVRNSFLDALEREPLIVGALGIAAGAALGAMLPATRTEERYLGPVGDKARRAVEDTLATGVDKARHVAEEVYSAARDEADSQGLLGDGKPLSERVSKVAQAAGEEMKTAADRSLRQGEKAVDSAMDKLQPPPRSGM